MTSVYEFASTNLTVGMQIKQMNASKVHVFSINLKPSIDLLYLFSFCFFNLISFLVLPVL